MLLLEFPTSIDQTATSGCEGSQLEPRWKFPEDHLKYLELYLNHNEYLEADVSISFHDIPIFPEYHGNVIWECHMGMSMSILSAKR